MTFRVVRRQRRVVQPPVLQVVLGRVSVPGGKEGRDGGRKGSFIPPFLNILPSPLPPSIPSSFPSFVPSFLRRKKGIKEGGKDIIRKEGRKNIKKGREDGRKDIKEGRTVIQEGKNATQERRKTSLNKAGKGRNRVRNKGGDVPILNRKRAGEFHPVPLGLKEGRKDRKRKGRKLRGTKEA
jgi:hypothetical protein